MRIEISDEIERSDQQDTVQAVSVADPFAEFHAGTIDEEQLLRRCRGNPDRLVRLAHMYRDGDGVDIDPDACSEFLRQALKVGCREAGWEILGSPEREGERIHDPLTGRTAVVWMMRRRETRRLVAPNHLVVDSVEDDGFEEEAKERAAERPEIAASMICAGYVGRNREEFEEWVALAKDSFRKDVLFHRGDYELNDGDPEKGIALLEESASAGSADGAMELGCELFTGSRTARDIGSAFRFSLAAAEGGNRDASCWLALFEDLPPAGKGEGRLNRYDTGGMSRSRLRYALPERSKEAYPEFVVLLDMLGMDGNGSNGRMCDGYGGFENDVFWIRPYYWGEPEHDDYDLSRADMPNFRFKPTGFEIEWYGCPFHDSYMNRDIDLIAIRAIWRICIQSLLDQADRGELA